MKKEHMATQPGEHTFYEITNQRQAWTQALGLVESNLSSFQSLFSEFSGEVILTGCGSTHYLAQSGAALLQLVTGRNSRAVPASEILINPQMCFSQSENQKLLIAISRSGSTSETIKAVEFFKREQLGKVIAITNYGKEPLAGLADLAYVISEGQEQSVAQTRSFASMYVCMTALCLAAAGLEAERQSMAVLSELGATLLQQSETYVRCLGENLQLDRFYFLGNGPRYGLANEVSLKMKEMTLSHSEPFHFLEFRHGPISMINENSLVIALLSEDGRTLEEQVLKDVRKLGGHVLTVAEKNADISFNSGISELARNVLYLPALQLLAYYRSIAKGLNPDQPHNLTSVVRLEL